MPATRVDRALPGSAVAPSTQRSWPSVLVGVLGLGLWLGLVTWRLGSVPGMSLDEAWSILSARGQRPPANPLSGMTSYAGPFPVLLLRVFGTAEGVLVLRLASVVANGAALVLIGSFFRRLYPGRAVSAWALPLIATSPAWLVVLRTGIEVVMFTPLLVVLGLELFSRQTRRSAFAGGLVWGLLVYNHVIGVCFPIAIVVAFRIAYGEWPRVFLRAALQGGLLGIAPRCIALALYPQPLEGTAAGYSFWAALGDLRWVPLCLWRTLQGDTVYLRYVGRLALEPWPYWILGLAFFAPWVRQLSAVPRVARFALAAALISAILVTLAAPYIAVRFLMLPVIGLTASLAMLGAAAIERDVRWRWPITGVALAISTFNLGYDYNDFYATWQRQELGITKFFLGDRSKHTGNWAYFPKQELVRELRTLAPTQIVTVPTLERPLQVLLDGAPIEIALADKADHDAASVFLDYLYPDPPERHCAGFAGGEMCFRNPAPIAKFYVIYLELERP